MFQTSAWRNHKLWGKDPAIDLWGRGMGTLAYARSVSNLVFVGTGKYIKQIVLEIYHDHRLL